MNENVFLCMCVCMYVCTHACMYLYVPMWVLAQRLNITQQVYVAPTCACPQRARKKRQTRLSHTNSHPHMPHHHLVNRTQQKSVFERIHNRAVPATHLAKHLANATVPARPACKIYRKPACPTRSCMSVCMYVCMHACM